MESAPKLNSTNVEHPTQVSNVAASKVEGESCSDLVFSERIPSIKGLALKCLHAPMCPIIHGLPPVE